MQTNLQLLPLDISIYKLKSFQIKIEMNFRGFIEHWSIVALKFFKENVLVNFGVMVVFVKVKPLKLQKEPSIPFYPDLHVFLFIEIHSA